MISVLKRKEKEKIIRYLFYIFHSREVVLTALAKHLPQHLWHSSIRMLVNSFLDHYRIIGMIFFLLYNIFVRNAFIFDYYYNGFFFFVFPIFSSFNFKNIVFSKLLLPFKNIKDYRRLYRRLNRYSDIFSKSVDYVTIFSSH